MSLEEELAQFRGELDQFVAGVSKEVAAAETENDKVFDTARLVRSHLETEHATKEAVLETERRAEEVRAQVAALEQAFVQAAQTHTEKLGLNTTTQRTLQSAFEDLDSKLRLFALLGLTFERVPRGMSGLGEETDELLRLIFRQVDPADPDKAFTFAIHISDTDVYRVAECFPRVRFDDLLAAVNATNDFSRFVQGMRLRFRALVA